MTLSGWNRGNPVRTLGHHGDKSSQIPQFLGGVPLNGGSPIAGWFIMENPAKKMMIWGCPHVRKAPYEDGLR